jgi:MoaA/NifB/PqqE/SkfB family radical SAM enzyme
MSLALWHWHIEISSKCTLRCPRCARTEVPDSLLNTELDLEFFKRNFTPEFIENHVQKITFCGDDGDPIYAHDLIEVIKYFKSVKNVSIVIVTNGSYKKNEWWLDLASTLNEVDQIHFSIDGWDQFSNEQYRVNSDFDSIIRGVETMRANSNVYMLWDCIGFKFNEQRIEYMKAMAKKLGFDSFQLTKSTKFGSKYIHYGKNDPLEPTRKDLISTSHRFERRLWHFNNKIMAEPWKNKNNELLAHVKPIDSITPICHIGNKGLFINSRGEFYPCCWVANRYGHNDHWNKLGKKYNLNDNQLVDVVSDSFWNKDFVNNSYECSTKCLSKYVDKNYATEW